MSDNRILLAMSGGVDSTAAVLLLQREGWQVTGVTLDMGCNDDGIARATESCRRLGIRHIVRNCRDEFECRVILPFVAEYAAGRTPSPCVGCNRDIKFRIMLEIADDMGIEYIATGHYVQKICDPVSGEPQLFAAADRNKDQSYMLCLLTPQQLRRSVFPLGGVTKDEIRRIAGEYALPAASAKDSQDICFDGGDYREFIRARGVSFRAGSFVDPSGQILGQHIGLAAYTIGQRRGLGVSASQPLYVTAKNADANTVTLSVSEDLGKLNVRVCDVSWLDGRPAEEGTELSAKLRYAHSASAAHIEYDGSDAVLRFETPQRAPAPGQIAAFYCGDRILGGGVIHSAW